MNQAKKSVAVALLLACLLAACTTGQASGTTALSTDTPLPSQTNQAKATLTHTPTGTSDLKWSAGTKTLTVTVRLTGLVPKSTHPGHIHQGDCKTEGGPVVHTLKPVVADGRGVGTSETTIAQVTQGLPQRGWSLTFRNGPELTTDLQKLPITCGEIIHADAQSGFDQAAHVALGTAFAPNQAVSGNAQLTLVGDKLTVVTTLQGLAPQSSHMAHIHNGSCETQGPVQFALHPVVADALGNGTSTTVLSEPVPSIPSGGWYVMVRLGAPEGEPSPQTGGDGIACGNVVVG